MLNCNQRQYFNLFAFAFSNYCLYICDHYVFNPICSIIYNLRPIILKGVNSGPGNIMNNLC